MKERLPKEEYLPAESVCLRVRAATDGGELPPMLLQLGEREVLLTEDSPEAYFAAADGEMTLTVTTEVPTKRPRGLRLFLLCLLAILLSPLALILLLLNFFADQDGGIRPYSFFEGFRPYRIQRTLPLCPKAGASYTLIYTDSVYLRGEECYRPPSITLAGGEGVIAPPATVTANKRRLYGEFLLYHLPAYLLLYAISLALLALAVSLFFPPPLTAITVAVASVLLLVALSLLAAFTLFLCRTVRLLRRLSGKLFPNEVQNG